jgi:plastin-1
LIFLFLNPAFALINELTFVRTLSVQDGTAYCLLLHQLAPESCSLEPLHIEDLAERAKAVLAQADRINCRKYITPKDMVDGSANLNLAFVAHLFHTRFVLISTSIISS